MVVDPVIVTAAIALIGGMAGLLLVMYRAFMSGELHPKTTVPRDSFDKLVAINETYATRFEEQTKAITELTAALLRTQK
jgi:hypothetical protein